MQSVVTRVRTGGVATRRAVVANVWRRRWVVGGVLGAALGVPRQVARAEEPLKEEEATEEVRRIELSPKDAFYVVEGLKLGEVIDNYLEMVRLNNAEHVLCNDAIFLHALAAYDLVCRKIGADEVRTIFLEKYKVFNMRCGSDEEIMWA